MRKFYLPLLAGVFTILFSSEVKAQLLNNGGFESGSLNPGWLSNGTVQVATSINVRNNQTGQDESVKANGGTHFAILQNTQSLAVLQSRKFSINQNPTGVRIQTMYFPAGTDRFIMIMQGTKAARLDDSSGQMVVDTVLNVTFQVPGARFPWQTLNLAVNDSFWRGETADSLLITFLPGQLQNSTLCIDDVFLTDYAASFGPVRLLSGEVKLYPNPTTALQATHVEYVLNMKSNVNVGIYDLNGRLVKALLQQEQEYGTYNLPVDVKNLNAGIYFVKIKTDHMVESYRLVVQ
jgi:hypothetical protein